jgi:hypothetical protein
MDWQDMRVVEPGGEPDLAQEALRAEGVSQLRVQDLERDGTVMLEIMREVDRGHPPAPELALKHVAVG